MADTTDKKSLSLDGARKVLDAALAEAKKQKFNLSIKAWEETFATRPAIANLPGVLPIEGGVPLIVGGKVVGAIGASGASSAQDGQVAAVGAATLG